MHSPQERNYDATLDLAQQMLRNRIYVSERKLRELARKAASLFCFGWYGDLYAVVDMVIKEWEEQV